MDDKHEEDDNDSDDKDDSTDHRGLLLTRELLSANLGS
jgi:hypothetical protein